MATDTLNDDEQETVDSAFDDFDLTESEVEDAVDGADDEVVETGGETLDDEPAEGESEGEPKVDEGEGAEARVDASPKGDKARDTKSGKFVKKGEQKAGEAAAKPGEAAAEGAAAAPKWEKLSVSVDKGIYPIEEAIVTKHGDSHIIAVKSTDFPRFQQRMQRAVVADRMWRQITDAVNEVEERRALEKDAPQPKSEREIEADTILDYLNEVDEATGKSRMAGMIEPRELKWLADRVKKNQLEYKETFSKTKSEFVTKRQQERATETETAGESETQLRGMAQVLLGMASGTGPDGTEYPQEVKDLFKDATEAELKEVYGALVPLRRSAYWKEGKQWFSDFQLIYNTAKQTIAGLRKSATPGKPGTPAAKPDPKTARAERLNKGQETQSTSLKNRRAPLRPSDKEHPRKAKPESGETQHSRAQDAEDKYRKATRDYMKSDGFDLPDEDEE